MGTSFGDLAKLQSWRERIGRMVGVPERVAVEVAPKFAGLVEKGFATKADPYGAGWKPIKSATYARGTKSALVRTGRMLEEIDYLPFGKRVKVLLGTFYARFHISTGRRTLPKPGQLPPKWSEVVKVEVERAFERIAAGGR
jgi:hypothetical protein